MSLVSIADLLTQPSDRLALYRAKASDLGQMYEDFIRSDDDDVEFTVGWHGAKARAAGIHASEISGECRRQVWYSLMGETREDKELDPFWKKRFRVGHIYHSMVQEDWRRLCEKSNGMLSFESEVRISPELQEIAEQHDIQSSCDGRIVFHETPYGRPLIRVGLEIKTESPDQFKDLKEPKQMHLRQTCVYMKCLDLPLMYTQYINKGNQNIVPSKPPWLFSFDVNLWNKIEAEMNEAVEYATRNEIPDRKESLGCKFCGYSWVCQPRTLKQDQARAAGKRERERQQKRLRVIGPAGIRTPKGQSK